MIYVATITLLYHVFMIGFDEERRWVWFCAAMMNFNWLVSELQLKGMLP